MSKLLSPKEVAEKTGIPLGTLRFYIRNGQSPFKFRCLPTGKIVISEEELRSGIENLPAYISKKERCNDEKK